MVPQGEGHGSIYSLSKPIAHMMQQLEEEKLDRAAGAPSPAAAHPPKEPQHSPSSGSGPSAAQQRQPTVTTSNPPKAAVAGGGSRRSPSAAKRTPLTLAELRAKAAFRACDRLMEHGANDAAQLWSVARVMSGTEYEQAAEERALAGKCGNPLCATPAPEQYSGNGRYRISTSQQVVYDKAAAAEAASIFCSPQCAAEVRRFAGRLGNGSLALERFSVMYHQVRQQQQGQRGQAAQLQQAQAQVQDSAPPASQTTAEGGQTRAAAAAGSAECSGLLQAGSSVSSSLPSSGSSGSSTMDTAPAGLRSTTMHSPLVVEQVEIKRIDSSAGQFGDFSRKVKAKPAGSSTGAGVGGMPAAPKLKGVLKKHSQFAAGTAKVPIMLAEVKERDPSLVAAETARSLPAAVVAAAAGSRSRSLSAVATAVEGYVPRAVNSQHKASGRQRQRRVRWSDEVELEQEQVEQGQEHGQAEEGQEAGAGQAEGAQQEEEGQQAGSDQGAVMAAQQVSLEQPEGAAQRPDHAAEQRASHAAGPLAVVAGTVGDDGQQAGQAGPAVAGSDAGGGAGGAAVAPGSSVLVFEVEEPSGLLEASQTGLAAHFGRLRVADASTPPAAVPADSTASAAGNGGAAASGPATAPPLCGAPAAASPSSSIDIQRRSSSGSMGTFSVPPEWREAPQFYAHSPVGSSSSLAGSLASPAGSSGNLAAAAGASSPPVRGSSSSSSTRAPTSRPSPGPPGLPRGPSSSSRTGGHSGSQAQPVGRPQAPEEQLQQQGEQTEQPAQVPAPAGQPILSKRQAEQLQRAFPPLAAVLPPELQAALASDSETESEAADSEGWMQSDEEEELAGSSSGDEDEMLLDGRSGFRIQLSFFGTLFTHLEAWVTSNTVELLSSGPDVALVPPPPTSPEVLATLSRFLAAALPPVLSGLQAAAPRGEVERSLTELLRTLRLVGPLPAFQATQWQVVAVLLLKALSLERCPVLREAFETREGIGRMNQLLARLSFTGEEFYAALELLCPVE